MVLLGDRYRRLVYWVFHGKGGEGGSPRREIEDSFVKRYVIRYPYQ